MKNTIIITGGCGYIGSHIATYMIQQGFNVVLIDNLLNSNDDVPSKINDITKVFPDFYNYDLKNYFNIEKVFNLYPNISAIIYCAGLSSRSDSYQQIFEYYDNNVIAAINLFKLMQKYNIKNIILSSHANVYDINGASPPFTENDPLDTTIPLVNTHLVIEKILKNLSENYGFNVMNLRFFDILGVHESGKLGENYFKQNKNILYQIFDVIEGKTPKITINSDPNSSDKTPSYDYLHISDLVLAYYNAYNFLMKYISTATNSTEGIFGTINIGSGTTLSIKKILLKIEILLGKSVPFEIITTNKKLFSNLSVDISRAVQYLNWKPTNTIDNAILSSYKYYQNYKH